MPKIAYDESAKFPAARRLFLRIRILLNRFKLPILTKGWISKATVGVSCGQSKRGRTWGIVRLQAGCGRFEAWSQIT